MPHPDDQFAAIIADFVSALSVLKDVLTHVESSALDPSLRVVILNNTIVALTAAVEETLRDLFKEYLNILENNITDHRSLRVELQNANFDCAIQMLRSYKKNGGLTSVTDVVNNMHKCLSGGTGYSLLKDQLVYNEANFKSTQVTEIAKSTGITNFWRDVCDCREIEEFTSEDNIDARVTMLIAKWNEIFDERNLVVHRVSQASGWAPERILQAIKLAQMVVNRMSDCICEDARENIGP